MVSGKIVSATFCTKAHASELSRTKQNAKTFSGLPVSALLPCCYGF
jgi:hypothetical protein